MSKTRRQIMDDIFDAFCMLARGNNVSIYDTMEKVTRYSPGAVEQFGLPGEYLPDDAYDWEDYVHPEDRKKYRDTMSNLLDRGVMTYNLTYRVKLKDGKYASFRFMGATIGGEDSKAGFLGGMMIQEDQAENIDPITSLRNRDCFFVDLADAIENDQSKVVLLLGINRLSYINTIYGYNHGNKVLQKVGWMIQEAVGFDAKVYRMTGARFAFATGNLTQQQIAELYEKLRHKMQSGIMIDGVYHSLTLNAGMLTMNDIKMNERTVYACLSYVYQESKYRKHGRLVAFEGVGDADARRSFELIDHIRSSIFDDCRGFYIEYQPIYDKEVSKPIAVEALVRWKDEEHGVVYPVDFIHILERDFAFDQLVDWILVAAMRDGVKFLQKDPEFLLGINISPVQLERENFEANVMRVASLTGFPLKNLCLEFTRDCRLLDAGYLKDTVDSLREKEISIVFDDFGKGYSSLDYLKELSADYVKIDLDLVQNVTDQEDGQKVAFHLAELASYYGSKVCAKSVETKQMYDLIKDYPLSGMQGYYFSKAL
ncbi:MAG: EAL domain-containing protein, partial [Lachnospiraceae bacterium]|nr:EAL domain-containing protein [Lachnospiraceae bacterium]